MTFCGYCGAGLPADDHTVRDAPFEIVGCPQVPADTMYLGNPDRPSLTVRGLGRPS